MFSSIRTSRNINGSTQLIRDECESHFWAFLYGIVAGVYDLKTIEWIGASIPVRVPRFVKADPLELADLVDEVFISCNVVDEVQLREACEMKMNFLQERVEFKFTSDVLRDVFQWCYPAWRSLYNGVASLNAQSAVTNPNFWVGIFGDGLRRTLQPFPWSEDMLPPTLDIVVRNLPDYERSPSPPTLLLPDISQPSTGMLSF